MARFLSAYTPYEHVYNLLRIIGDILMLSLLRTLFFNTKNINDTRRKLLLLITLVVTVLNCLGIYRNSFTLWKYQDFMSYFWLGSDILQLIFCSFIYCFVYMKDKVPNAMSVLLLFAGGFFLLLNIYNFLVNFKWLPYEGFVVFTFWFINNGAMVTFSAMIVYLLVTGRIGLRKA
jgi:hypothetical protein